ncbi:DNA topoisomerase [Mesorhizobium sanjuanii]|uniref:DNA topoisomerase n=1 Tax=Mesorhizobium sanjuanii TaxID=2037900 RepID=A0A2A6FK35_9HYPH|nr:DNA topoisomerase IB [Mesorhizobium sanjuanii]PDQ22330.1 DNA topoisomerase [Mesorhizobium sanjuanii]
MLDKSESPSGRLAAISGNASKNGASKNGASKNGAPRNGGEASADRASLTYVSDAEPGIRRARTGKGFSYKGPNRRAVSEDAVARIKALAIPPAWTDVWISPDANGHIQATGRDQRGRKQYRYHAQWAEERDGVKYSSLIAFAESLPELRRRIDADLRRHGLPLERVVAAVVWLLDNTMIRVGNAAYARDNNSFGLTTLRDRHVEIKGSSLRFAFKGKSGKEWKLKLVDRRIARIVRGAQDLPGQKLFQYLDEDGNRRPIRSDDVNRYIRDEAGADFSSKHFRTWGGTIHAASLFAQTERPESQAQQKRLINGVVDKVAERLGNTRAVCRKCYIHPQVFKAWSEGRLLTEMAEANRGKRSIQGLDDEEALVLRWLKAREG